jgi:hypothetical protein
VRRLGWSPARVVVRELRLRAACYGGPSKRRVIGVGRLPLAFGIWARTSSITRFQPLPLNWRGILLPLGRMFSLLVGRFQ